MVRLGKVWATLTGNHPYSLMQEDQGYQIGHDIKQTGSTIGFAARLNPLDLTRRIPNRNGALLLLRKSNLLR
jgi:hypothetical protein